jgi:PEP-CTERM motif
LLHDGIYYNNFYNGDPANHIGDPQFYLNAGQPNLEPWLMVSEVSFLSAVPEPSTWVMMIAGFAGLGLAADRRKTKSAMAMT